VGETERRRLLGRCRLCREDKVNTDFYVSYIMLVIVTKEMHIS